MAHDIRSFGRSALVLMHVLAALVVALLVVVFYVRPDMFGPYDETAGVVEIPYRTSALLDAVFLAALLLLALDVLFVLYGRPPRQPLRFVLSHGPAGIVRIARDALEAGLRSAGEALDVVTRLRVVVGHGGLKRIVVKAYFQAPDGVSIQAAFERLRQVLDDRFREMVRLADGMKAEFEIEFVGFAGKLARKPEEPIEDEPATFTGPQYPIDEDSSREGLDVR